MSYDLTLFRPLEGADPSLPYEKLMEQQDRESADLDAWKRRPVSDQRRAEMESTAAALQSWRPSLERFHSAAPLPWIELNDEDLQLQYEVFESTVSITMPYFRDRAQETMECVTESFEIIKASIGYVAYDPQLERIVTAADLREMVARYRAMDRALPEILAQSRESLAAETRPGWKLW